MRELIDNRKKGIGGREKMTKSKRESLKGKK
jgi:hypothetical protein